MHTTRWRSYRRGMPGLLLGTWECLAAADALAADMWDMPMMRGGWGMLMMLMMLREHSVILTFPAAAVGTA